MAELAQVGLAVPLWNLDNQTINHFAEALLLDESLVFLTIKSEGPTITQRSRAGFEGKDFFYFDQSPQFRVKAADILFDKKKIGTIQLAVSRETLKKEVILNIVIIVVLTILLIAAISLTSVLISRRYISAPLLRLPELRRPRSLAEIWRPPLIPRGVTRSARWHALSMQCVARSSS